MRATATVTAAVAVLFSLVSANPAGDTIPGDNCAVFNTKTQPTDTRVCDQEGAFPKERLPGDDSKMILRILYKNDKEQCWMECARNPDCRWAKYTDFAKDADHCDLYSGLLENTGFDPSQPSGTFSPTTFSVYDCFDLDFQSTCLPKAGDAEDESSEYPDPYNTGVTTEMQHPWSSRGSAKGSEVKVRNNLSGGEGQFSPTPNKDHFFQAKVFAENAADLTQRMRLPLKDQSFTLSYLYNFNRQVVFEKSQAALSYRIRVTYCGDQIDEVTRSVKEFDNVWHERKISGVAKGCPLHPGTPLDFFVEPIFTPPTGNKYAAYIGLDNILMVPGIQI